MSAETTEKPVESDFDHSYNFEVEKVYDAVVRELPNVLDPTRTSYALKLLVPETNAQGQWVFVKTGLTLQVGQTVRVKIIRRTKSGRAAFGVLA